MHYFLHFKSRKHRINRRNFAQVCGVCLQAFYIRFKKIKLYFLNVFYGITVNQTQEVK